MSIKVCSFIDGNCRAVFLEFNFLTLSSDGRHVLIQPLCQAISNLITIDNRNEDKSKIDSKLELVGKVLAELMDVLEKKNIVSTKSIKTLEKSNLS